MLPSVLILTLLSKPSTSTFFSTWLTSCTRELENLWVNEKHDTTKGKKLFIDILTNVNGISNVVFENTSKYTPGESIIPATDMGYLRMFYRNLYPNLDRQGLEELAQVTIVLTFCGTPEVLGFSNPHASVVSS
jgi:hypothetical protein